MDCTTNIGWRRSPREIERTSADHSYQLLRKRSERMESAAPLL